MHEYRYGSTGSKICIVHGWMHSSKLYEKLAMRLSEQHTVHAIDLPGFGDSRGISIDGDSLIDALTAQVEQYLQRHNFDLIIAHSLGAAIILRILNRQTPSKQIILSNPAYLGIAQLQKFSKHTSFLQFLFRLQASMPILLAKPFVKLAALLTINDPALIDDIVVADARRADAAAASKLLYEICNDRWRFTRTQYDCDVSILISEKDRLIAKRNMDILKQDLNCALDTIPQIGHTPVVENFDFTYAYIMRKLEQYDERLQIHI